MVALPPEPAGPDSDPFKPPATATAVRCLHCDQEYDSSAILWVPDASFGTNGGYWACPVPGCDGKGFCFDIWPTDPDWTDEHGAKVWFDDEPGDDDDELDESDEEDKFLDIPY